MWRQSTERFTGAALKDGVTWPQAKNAQQPPESGRQEVNFPPKSSRGSTALPTAWIQPSGTDLGLWPPELRKKRFLLFRARQFVTLCYSTGNNRFPQKLSMNFALSFGRRRVRREKESDMLLALLIFLVFFKWWSGHPRHRWTQHPSGILDNTGGRHSKEPHWCKEDSCCSEHDMADCVLFSSELFTLHTQGTKIRANLHHHTLQLHAFIPTSWELMIHGALSPSVTSI